MSRTLTIDTDDRLEDALRERADTRLPPVSRRETEHAWRQSHRETLQGCYAGQWVVLEGEEVVAHGKDAVQAVEEARTKGVVVPYLFFVQPARPPGLVRMGL